MLRLLPLLVALFAVPAFAAPDAPAPAPAVVAAPVATPAPAPAASPAPRPAVEAPAPALPPSAKPAASPAPATASTEAIPTPSPVIPDPNAGVPSDLAKEFLDAVKTGNWKLTLILALVLIIWGVRKYGSKLAAVPVKWVAAIGKFIASDRGGAVLAMVAGVIGSVAAYMVGGANLTPKVLLDGLLLGFTAAGGWVVMKKIIVPAKAATP